MAHRRLDRLSRMWRDHVTKRRLARLAHRRLDRLTRMWRAHVMKRRLARLAERRLCRLVGRWPVHLHAWRRDRLRKWRQVRLSMVGVVGRLCHVERWRLARHWRLKRRQQVGDGWPRWWRWRLERGGVGDEGSCRGRQLLLLPPVPLEGALALSVAPD